MDFRLEYNYYNLTYIRGYETSEGLGLKLRVSGVEGSILVKHDTKITVLYSILDLCITNSKALVERFFVGRAKGHDLSLLDVDLESQSFAKIR